MHSKILYFAPVEGDHRLTTFPVARPNLFAYYKDSYDNFWTVDEISLKDDVIDYQTKLTPGEQRLIDYILAFFAAGDFLVNVNLAKRFKEEVDMYDAGIFYDYQIMMENVHAHTYSTLLWSIIPNQQKRDKLLNAITTIPVIAKMAEYQQNCTNSDEPLPKRLLRMAVVEGIYFTAAFCIIYWYQERGLMPGLSQSNEKISIDESLHTVFSLALYDLTLPEYKLTQDQIYDIFREGVNIAVEFISDALPKGMLGMNIELLKSYIECQADNLLTLIDIEPLYHSKHDFHYMDKINATLKTNFFERKNSVYSKTTMADDNAYDVQTDF